MLQCVLCRLMNYKLLFSKVKIASLPETYLSCQNNTNSNSNSLYIESVMVESVGHGVRWIPHTTAY